MDAAAEFAELFPAVYLRFHARRRKADARLTPQMAAVLQHLALSGPLTVGEMALHFDRAQSVVSEIIGGLVRKGLLERLRDARDRRRSLVWLTEAAHAHMQRDRRVLDDALLSSAIAKMTATDRTALLRGMRALVHAAAIDAPASHKETHRKSR